MQRKIRSKINYHEWNCLLSPQCGRKVKLGLIYHSITARLMRYSRRSSFLREHRQLIFLSREKEGIFFFVFLLVHLNGWFYANYKPQVACFQKVLGVARKLTFQEVYFFIKSTKAGTLYCLFGFVKYFRLSPVFHWYWTLPAMIRYIYHKIRGAILFCVRSFKKRTRDQFLIHCYFVLRSP